MKILKPFSTAILGLLFTAPLLGAPPVIQDLNVTTPEDTPLVFSLGDTRDPDGDLVIFSLISQTSHGEASLLGDVNFDGYTSPLDALLLINFLNNNGTLDPKSTIRGDMNQDGVITGTDPEAIIAILNKEISNHRAVYIPNENYFGPDQFSFAATDGRETADPKTAAITVTPVNDAPVVAGIPDQTINQHESFAQISLDDFVTDVDNFDEEMTWAVEGNTNLTILFAGRVAKIQPLSPFWYGSETLTFTATDPGLASGSSTATFTINNVNDPPIIHDMDVTTPEDIPVVFSLGDTKDPDNDWVTYSFASQPANGRSFHLGDVNGNGIISPSDPLVLINFLNNGGTLPFEQKIRGDMNQDGFITEVDAELIIALLNSQDTNNRAVYFPNENYFGPDQFNFEATDGSLTAGPKTVSITVTPVNDAPVVTGIPDQTVNQGESFAEILLDIYVTDVDNTPEEMTWSVDGNVNLAVEIINRTAKIQAESAEWHGAETLTFIASDPGSLSGNSLATFTVLMVNGPPIISDINITIAEDTSKVFSLGDPLDPDGDLVTYDILSRPTHIAAFFLGDVNGNHEINSYDRSLIIDHLNGITLNSHQQILADLNQDGLISQTDADMVHAIINNQVSNNWAVVFPFVNFFGSDQFDFNATDGTHTADPKTVFVTVTPVNDPPVVLGIPDQTIDQGEEFQKIYLDKFVTDVEHSDDQLSWTVEGNANLIVTIVDRIATIETATPTWAGSEALTFIATDPELAQGAETATFTIVEVNNPPVINDLNITTPEDTPIVFSLGDSRDSDQDLVTYNFLSQPTDGETFFMGDVNGDGLFSPLDALLLINYLNGSSLTPEQMARGDMNQDGSITDADPLLIIAILNQESSNNQAIYFPNKDFFGSDQFDFNATDGRLTTDPKTVFITVTPVNDAPVVSEIPDQTVNQGEPFAMIALDNFVSDVDHEPEEMTWTVEGNVNLVVEIVNRVATLQPANPYWYGAETLTFIAADPDLATDRSSATFTIINVNDPPIITDLDITTPEDIPAVFSLGDPTDPDNDLVTFARVSQPGNGRFFHLGDVNGDGLISPFDSLLLINFLNNGGTLPFEQKIRGDMNRDGHIAPLDVLLINGILNSQKSNNWAVYFPDENFHGPDQFDFEATDGTLTAGPQTVSLTVTPVNDAPVVSEISDQTVNQGEPFVEILLDNHVSDVDNTPEEMTWTVEGNQDLIVFINNRIATIQVATPTWAGAETLTFIATDPGFESGQSTATFRVINKNDPPNITDLNITTPEDTPKAFSLGDQRDPDGDWVTYAFLSQPTYGQVFFIGDVNGDGFFSPLDALLIINYLNGSSLTDDQKVRADMNRDGTITGVDAELIIAILNKESTNNWAAYFPHSNYFGPDQFDFNATDGILTADFKTVFITVTPVNDAPVVAGIPDQTINQDETFQEIYLDNYVTDPDNNPEEMTWTIEGNQDLIVFINNRVATILVSTPTWHGSETLTFITTDPGNASGSSTATFRVVDSNSPPVISDKSVETSEDTPVVFVLGDMRDSDGDLVTYAFLSNPTHGRSFFLGDVNGDGLFSPLDALLLINFLNGNSLGDEEKIRGDMNQDGIITPIDPKLIIDILNQQASNRRAVYFPEPNYFGPDEFDFNATDGRLTTAPKTVSINVTPVNDAPVVSGILDQAIDWGEPFLLIPLDDHVSDVDNDDDEMTWEVRGEVHLRVTIVDRVATVAPIDPFWTGSEALTFIATDPGNLSGDDTALFEIHGEVNFPPVAVNDNASTDIRTPIYIDVLKNDTDRNGNETINPESIRLVLPPEKGRAVVDDGKVLYVPEAPGIFSFKYTVNDFQGATSNEALVSVRVKDFYGGAAASASAGGKRTLFFPNPGYLNGSILDPKFGEGETVEMLWKPSDGSDLVTIGNPKDPNTPVSFEKPGTYTIKYRVENETHVSEDVITLTILPMPKVEAGKRQEITTGKKVQLNGLLQAGASALDSSFDFRYQWQVENGNPLDVVFDNPQSPNTSASFNRPGTYILKLTAKEGPLAQSADTVEIVVQASPSGQNTVDKTFFNPKDGESITIPYAVSSDGSVEIDIYNIRGQLVRSLVNDHRMAGSYSVVWDGKNESRNTVASGIYLVVIKESGKKPHIEKIAAIN